MYVFVCIGVCVYEVCVFAKNFMYCVSDSMLNDISSTLRDIHDAQLKIKKE